MTRRQVSVARAAALMAGLALGATLLAAGRQDPPGGLDPESRAVVAKAEAVVDLLVQQKFAQVVAEFDAVMTSAMPEDQLRTTWTTLLTQVGAFRKRESSRVEMRGAFRVGVVTCVFERASLDLQLVFDHGKITGLFIRPAASTAPYTPPAYVTPSAFSETEVTVGVAPWTLPGTLSMPSGAGPFPAVVLVHGSGPNDRDESLGPNKLFRDLALGLASRGVAVLRYEKRTRLYPTSVGAGATVKDEVIDDVVAAVNVLRRQARVDPARIFVLGHSLGGTLVPRIAAAEPRAAGFIVMAGVVSPLDVTILAQTRYLAMADGAISPAEQASIDSAQALIATVAALKPADAASPASIFGAPASYWLDLRGYNPATAARAIKRPLLILQGERDYQVTMAEFAAWKAALASMPTVTFKSYPALNHIFQPGSGPSVPAEYNVAGHVPEEVVRDIASWIAGRT